MRTDDASEVATTGLGDVLSRTAPDADVLLTGSALSGKDRIGLRFLAEARAHDEVPVAVTTTDTAAQFRERFGAAAGTDGDRVLVVECTDAPTPADDDAAYTHRVGSPADLTGIGIAVSNALDWAGERGASGARLLVDNLTTLLIYAEFDRVFRFVDAFTRRTGVRTMHLLDRDAVDEQDGNRLRQLFSAVVEVREAAGATEYRIDDGRLGEWQEYADDAGGDRP